VAIVTNIARDRVDQTQHTAVEVIMNLIRAYFHWVFQVGWQWQQIGIVINSYL